jgi:hypothetical protein
MDEMSSYPQLDIAMLPVIPALAALLALSSPASAPRGFCVAPPPSEEHPERLVARAALIVHAVAERELSRSEADSAGLDSLFMGMKWLEFRVTEVLKGEERPLLLHIPGYLTDSDDFNLNRVPYKRPRPDTYDGMCRAYRYRRGGEFLLLLLRTDGAGFTPYWNVTGPTNEQLRGPGDRWLRWVRRQVANAGPGTASH